MTLARDTDQSPSVAAPASEERYREALQATQAALIKTQALYRV